MSSMIIILLIETLMLAILHLLDGYTTVKLLASGGTELNKVLKSLMDKIGVIPALVVYKSLSMVAMLLLLVISIYYPITWIQVALTLIATIIILAFLVVIIHNFLQLRKSR